MVKVQRLFAKTNLKIRVCGAKQNNERPSGAFEWQPGLAQQDRGASPRQGLLQNAGVLQKCSPGGTQHFQELKKTDFTY